MSDRASLRDEAPELAERRLAATGLMLPATIRRPGQPVRVDIKW